MHAFPFFCLRFCCFDWKDLEKPDLIWVTFDGGQFFSGLRKLYLYTCRRTNCLSITQHLKWGNKWWKILLLLKHQMSPSLIWKQFAKSHFYCFPSFIHKKLVKGPCQINLQQERSFLFCFLFCRHQGKTGDRCLSVSNPFIPGGLPGAHIKAAALPQHR